ncbi:MAG TPA: glyceraldehyde 3-phosphate dehydrogenase NAD-binding domain-containing protein, partial [Chitinophagaceae bacterium]|nr:glyceraldehyde 3-phosphate dehydrogenase NAD-binding domain-containing protein [Chitinophagaceae bacterium]
MKIAINGMGRIGRLLFRRLIDHPGIELVAVNDIMPADNLAYLLKYDSVYGTFAGDIHLDGETLITNEKRISVF